MRPTPPTYGFAPYRTINARATLRDLRLNFQPVWTGSSLDFYSLDTAVYNNQVVQVGAVYNGANPAPLYYRWLKDPLNPATWTAWAQIGSPPIIPYMYTRPGCGISLSGDGNLGFLNDAQGFFATSHMTADSNGIGFFPPVVEFSQFTPNPAAQYGVHASPTGIYIFEVLEATGRILYLHSDGVNWSEFPGRFYAEEEDTYLYQMWGTLFSGATYRARKGSTFYSKTMLIVGDSRGRRAYKLTHQFTTASTNLGDWGTLEPVIPLDIVDDTTYFRPQHLNILGATLFTADRMFLTGTLSRANGDSMDVYLMNPVEEEDFQRNSFTQGREMYVKPGELKNIAATALAPIWWMLRTDMPVNDGKIVQRGDDLFWVGSTQVLHARASQLAGRDPADLKYVTSDIGNIKYQAEAGTAARLMLNIKNDLPEIFAAGKQLDLEIQVDDDFIKLGTFGVDIAAGTQDGDGAERTLTARSAGLRRLNQWTSDASYDYWSQTKQQTIPADLDEMATISGIWAKGEANELSPDVFLKNCVLATTAHSGKGMLARAKFTSNEDFINGAYTKYGVMVNYYHETQQEANAHVITAFVWPPIDVSGANYPMAHTGFLFVYDNQDFKLYHLDIQDDQPLSHFSNTLLATFNQPYLLPGTLHMELVYQDGRLIGRYKTLGDGGIDWHVAIDTQLTANVSRRPFYHDTGRGAVLMRVDSPASMGFPFAENALVIPVTDATVFAPSGEVRVDQEVITYSATHGGNVREENLSVVSASGNQVVLSGIGNASGATLFTGAALVVTEGQGMDASYQITAYEPNVSGNRRVTLERTPFLQAGESICAVVPALTIQTRGTTPAPHAAVMVCTNANNIGKVVDFQYYTTDMDMRLEDMTWEIARKAGIQKVVSEKLVLGDQAIYLPYARSAYDAARTKSSFIIRLWPTFPDEYAALGIFRLDPTTGNGFGLGVSNGFAKFFAFTNYELGAVLESLPVTIGEGWITFSYYGGFFSAWHNGRLLASFYGAISDTAGPSGLFTATVSPDFNNGFPYAGTINAKVDWSACDLRVDNFILDMGRKGQELLDGLIGDRRYFYLDDVDGNLHLFRNHTAIGGGAFSLVTAQSKVETDTDLVSRLRVEGIDVIELNNPGLLASMGNFFAMLNLKDPNTRDEMVEEARMLLGDGSANLEHRTLEAVPDLRIDPQDIWKVSLPEGERDLMVESVNLLINLGEELQYNMVVEAHDA